MFLNERSPLSKVLKKTILCECGEFIQCHTFKDYIPTSIGPSTSTFGHSDCGLIFNLIDGELPKRFSTRVQLKGIAMRFAEMNKMEDEFVCLFLLEVDRLKSQGNISDIDILIHLWNEERNLVVTVLNHPKLAKGTLISIMKQARLERKDFTAALKE